MLAESRNGVNHGGVDGPPSPSINGSNGVHPPEESPSANGSDGRDTKGRYAKGKAGGPGNPFARRMAQMRSVLCAAVSEEDVEAVTRKLVEQAQAGEVAAARVLLAYVVGQPTAAVDPDTLDAQEWQVFRQLPVPAAEMQNIMSGVPLDFACKLARTLAPFLGEMAAAKARQVFSSESQPTEKSRRRRKRRKRQRGGKAQEPEMTGSVQLRTRRAHEILAGASG